MRRPSQPADSLEDSIRNSAHGVSPRRRMLDTSGKEGAKFSCLGRVSGDPHATAHRLSRRACSKFLRIRHIRKVERLAPFRQRDPRIPQACIMFPLLGIVCFLRQRCAPGCRFPCSLTFGSHLVVSNVGPSDRYSRSCLHATSSRAHPAPARRSDALRSLNDPPSLIVRRQAGAGCRKDRGSGLVLRWLPSTYAGHAPSWFDFTGNASCLRPVPSAHLFIGTQYLSPVTTSPRRRRCVTSTSLAIFKSLP
jgi:hypothetical protein